MVFSRVVVNPVFPLVDDLVGDVFDRRISLVLPLRLERRCELEVLDDAVPDTLFNAAQAELVTPGEIAGRLNTAWLPRTK